MYRHVALALAALAVSTVAAVGAPAIPHGEAPVDPGDIFQIDYAANLNIGDSYVNFTNSGATVVNGVSQNICINLYTFDPQEELISCCTCSVTPNGLVSLSVIKSLISNPLPPAIPTSVVIKAVASTGACNPSVVPDPNGAIAHGLI